MSTKRGSGEAAQYPDLIVPNVTLSGSAAPQYILQLLASALAVDIVLLLPSFADLFSVFNRPESALEFGERGE